MNKKPTTPATGATSTNLKIKSITIPTKHELCLYELIKAGPSGIYKLGQCQQNYGETCLPTTISELGIKRKFLIDRVKKPHTNSAGGQTYFIWYWFPNSKEAEKAINLINAFRSKRGSSPIDPSEGEQLIAKFSETNQIPLD